MPLDKVLNPNKVILTYFLVRCVKILGRKKSLELLYATHDIDEAGGMYTEVNNLIKLDLEEFENVFFLF